MKKVLRSIQTLFPFLHSARFRIKFLLMRMRRTPHEYDFEAVKLFQPDSSEVFIDIGSNRGEAILSMLIKSNSATQIVGFEPNSLIFEKLKSYFHNNENVLVHNKGLANENTEIDLYVPFYRRWMFDGLGSFKHDEAKNWLKTRLWLYNEKRLTIKKVKCQIGKLDDFQLKPYFIKIDVQGYEMEVLKGGAETIKSHLPIILIESINEEHMNFLKPFGYEFYSFTEGKFKAGIGALNTFCINRERHPELHSSFD